MSDAWCYAHSEKVTETAGLISFCYRLSNEEVKILFNIF